MRKIFFVVAALDPEYKAFVVYIVALNINLDDKVYPLRRAQIVYLKVETSTKVLSEYNDFADIFLPKLIVKLLKNTKINDYTIELVDDWQFSYGPIYNLSQVELETLKTYIKNNLANGFINPSKSPVGASIFFNKKPNKSL